MSRNLAVSARNLAEGSNGKEGFLESCVHPRKQEQCGHSSSRPGERLGENILGIENEGWTLGLCGEEFGAGLGYLRARKRNGEASAARIGPWKLGNSSMSGGRGTTSGARPGKKTVGWKLILEKSRAGKGGCKN